MTKKHTPPTVAEQLERAKDGWFYEFPAKQWIHISQVETEDARIHFFQETYCKKRAAKFITWVDNFKKIAGWPILLLNVIVFLLPLPFGYGSAYFMFFVEHTWARMLLLGTMVVTLTADILFALRIILWRHFIGWPYRWYPFIRNHIDALKNGVIYDADGNEHTVHD